MPFPPCNRVVVMNDQTVLSYRHVLFPKVWFPISETKLTFLFEGSTGGEDPHLVHSSELPLTARCKVLQHFKFYIAEEKALHQRLLTPRSHFGRRQLQALASNLQLCRNCGRVMLSCLKTIPLRRFQSCQQHNRTKVSK